MSTPSDVQGMYVPTIWNNRTQMLPFSEIKLLGKKNLGNTCGGFSLCVSPPLVSDKNVSEFCQKSIYLALYTVVVSSRRVEAKRLRSSTEGLDGFTNGVVLLLDRDDTAPCRACNAVSACGDVRL